LAAATPTQAGIGTATGIEKYLLNLEDRAAEPQPLISAPLPITVGISYAFNKRECDFDGFGVQQMEMEILAAFAGLDVTPWLTLHGTLGSRDFDANIAGAGDMGSDLAGGLGGGLRLLSRQVQPNLANIMWIRVDASAYYAGSKIENSDSSVDWREFYCDLTFSIVTTPGESDEPKSLSLFVGPAVSLISGELKTAGGTSDYDEDQKIGLTAGLCVIPHDTISFKLEAQYFEDLSYGGALAYHF